MSFRPFIIHSLPRSRSAWTSQFLNYRATPTRVSHDLGARIDGIKDFAEAFWSRTLHGTCETGAAFAFDVFTRVMPSMRHFVIRRDVDEVLDSFVRLNLGLDLNLLRVEISLAAERLDAVSHAPNVVTIPFRDLGVDCYAWLFEELLGRKFDFDWWQALNERNIQVNVPNTLSALAARGEVIERIKTECMDSKLALVYIRTETVAEAEDDLRALGEADHMALHGASVVPDIENLLLAERGGGLKIFTARVNERLVGYLWWTLSQNLEQKGTLVARQGPWFVLPGFAKHRLGPRLLSESLATLRSWGVALALPHVHVNRNRSGAAGRFIEALGGKLTKLEYSISLTGDE